jgi:hypothetical protein
MLPENALCGKRFANAATGELEIRICGRSDSRNQYGTILRGYLTRPHLIPDERAILVLAARAKAGD